MGVIETFADANICIVFLLEVLTFSSKSASANSVVISENLEEKVGNQNTKAE